MIYIKIIACILSIAAVLIITKLGLDNMRATLINNDNEVIFINAIPKTEALIDSKYSSNFKITGLGNDQELLGLCNKLELNYVYVDELQKSYLINGVYALSVLALETGWGKSDVWIEYNNPAGIKCGTEYCSYTSKNEGIEAMFRILQMYVNEYDLSTIDEQRSLWSESEDTDKIVSIMNGVVDE